MVRGTPHFIVDAVRLHWSVKFFAMWNRRTCIILVLVTNSVHSMCTGFLVMHCCFWFAHAVFLFVSECVWISLQLGASVPTATFCHILCDYLYTHYLFTVHHFTVLTHTQTVHSTQPYTGEQTQAVDLQLYRSDHRCLTLIIFYCHAKCKSM